MDVVANEATRRGLGPTALMAEIVETWSESRAKVIRARQMVPCRFEECERAVYARELCRAHYVQRKRGEPLRPIREVPGPVVLLGTLRVPADMAQRLRRHARREGVAAAEVLRRALEALFGPVR